MSASQFDAGQMFKTIELPIDDDWFTADRVGMLDVVVQGYVADSADLIVAENDPRPVLSISGGAAIEGALGQTTKLDVTLTLSSPLGLDLQTTVTTTNGTADASDYTYFDGPVLFPPGALSKKVSIDIRGDAKVEADETFTVSVKSCCPSLATVGNGVATAVIHDRDRPPSPTSFRFEQQGAFAASESQKWLELTVIRDADTLPAEAATIKLQLGPTRPRSPLDVRFRAGEKRKSVRVYIDDAFYSGDTTGRVELLKSSVVVEQRDITLVDDEPRPVVSIENMDVTEGDSDRNAAFRISVEPLSYQAIDVLVQSQAGTAAGDFKNLPTHVTIPSMFPSASLPVTIVGDAISESTETFRVTLALPSGSPAVRGDVEATGTIHDDDRGARLTIASDRIQRGATVAMTLAIDTPSPIASVLRLSSTPGDVLGFEPTSTVVAGSSLVWIPVTGLRVGHAVLRADIGGTIVETPLFVHDVAVPVLGLDTIRVNQGAIASVPISLSPFAEEDVRVAITSLDTTIVGADGEVVIAPGVKTTFHVYGASRGSTHLSITLPAEYGGTTIVVPVEVTEHSGKARASRH